MLVIARKVGETIKISDNISITVTRIGFNQVKLGIEAPKNVNIVRSELEGNRIITKNILLDEKKPVR